MMAVELKCAQIAGQNSPIARTCIVNATQSALNTCIFAAAKRDIPERDIANLVDLPCL